MKQFIEMYLYHYFFAEETAGMYFKKSENEIRIFYNFPMQMTDIYCCVLRYSKHIAYINVKTTECTFSRS